jgi:histone deacetylase 6
MTEEQIKADIGKYERDSLYINNQTALASRLSCGGVISACEAVVQGVVKNAIAIVRPPGHHAEPTKSLGFCFLNNVAVAARVIQRDLGVKKILIVDWSVSLHSARTIYKQSG